MAARSIQKVILYARFSPRPDAAECESCDRQLADLREHAARQGWEVVGEYRDDALSGADEDRPGLEAAIGAMKRGWYLAVRSMDRLARGNALTEAILGQVTARGGAVATIDGVCTATETPQQEFWRVLQQAMAQYQRRLIREATSRRMRQHQAAGRIMSHVAPYGCRVVDGRLVPDEAEQAVIRQIMELAGDGMGCRQIADRLNAEGTPCRRNGWHHTTVQRVLRRALMPR